MKSWYQLQPVMLPSMTAIRWLLPICLFYEINEIPMIVELARLDDSGGIHDTLSKNQALYHRSCRLMFNKDKLGHARPRLCVHGKPSN